MTVDNHTHTSDPGQGGGELAPLRFNAGNGALYASDGGVGVGTAAPQSSLDVQSSSNSRFPVASISYKGGDAVHKVAVQGESAPRPDFGTGGLFRGGSTGIVARAEARGGTGERVGGEFWAQNGRATYAIKATTFGSTDPQSGVHIAGFFHADREQNHGEFWAGYFLGKVHISENVGIGTLEPAARLDVRGNVRIAGDNNSLIVDNPKAPASSNDSMGEKGQVSWDEHFLYVKTKSGPEHVWKRAKLEEW